MLVAIPPGMDKDKALEKARERQEDIGESGAFRTGKMPMYVWMTHKEANSIRDGYYSADPEVSKFHGNDLVALGCKLAEQKYILVEH